MLTTIAQIIQEIKGIGDTPKDKESKITVSEVWHLWDLVVARYDVIMETQLLLNFATDEEFKLILIKGLDTLKEQVKIKEGIMASYGIPLPDKPPEGVTNTTDVEEITDRYIYRHIYRGIQDFLNVHLSAVSQATDVQLRRRFIEFLKEEMEIFDMFVEYGKFKGWIINPPHYK